MTASVAKTSCMPEHRLFERSGRRPVRGFTLIELLVVIAIITLLLGVLLTALREARLISRRTACQSNLRQLAVTWQSYFDSHDGRLLKGINANINYGGKQGAGAAAWGGDPDNPIRKPLNPYLQLEEVSPGGCEVFRCPSDEGSNQIRPRHFDHYGTSYAMNVMLVGQTQLLILPFDPCAPVLFQVNQRLANHAISAQMPDPAKLILMGDFGWLNTITMWDTQRIEWHQKRCSHNLAFMDGHAAFTRIRKGLLLTPEYTMIPFQDLLDDTEASQQEAPCP